MATRPVHRKATRRAPVRPRARALDLVAGQNAILELIAAGSQLEEVLESLLRLLEQDAPGMACSIVLLDAEGKRVARCIGPSLPEGWRRGIEGEPIGPRAGSCGTAAFRRETVIVTDIAKDPLWTDYRDAALSFGLRACWSSPIMDGQSRVLGTFAMYFQKPARPTARHQRMIEVAVHIAAIAIARRQREEERERLAISLRERVKELTLFHAVSRRLERGPPLTPELLNELAAMIPPAWLHTEICEARIRYGDRVAATPGWRETPWRLAEEFRTSDGTTGSIEVVYLEDRPFLPEERSLLQALSVSFTTYLERLHVEAALHESAERYRLVNLATDDAVWDWDLRTGKLWWNDAVTKLFGWTKEDIGPDVHWWAECLHPDDRERAHDSLQRTAEGTGNVWTEEYRFRRKDGSYADIYDRGYVLRDPSGKVIRMIGAMQDITERKRAEQRIKRLNRTYQVLSSINSAIVRIRDREQLFREACRVAVEDGQFGIAWIGRVEADAAKVAPLVWGGTGLDEQLLERLGRCCAERNGISAIQRTIQEHRPAYCNDLGSEAAAAAAGEVVDMGFRSLVSLPLVAGGALVGVLILHTREQDFFDEDEMKLLGELSDDISFALEYIEKEEKVNELAYHEPLTRLPNRTSLQEWLAQAVHDAMAQRGALALLLLNLDNFRDINNTLGHVNGDQLLRYVAHVLSEALWTSDRVASLGGDEFAILLTRLADKSDIELVLQKIRAALDAPVSIAGIPVNIEARLGIALFPDHGETAETLWQHADVALRTAKERHEPHLFYSTDIDHYDPERLALVGELRDAIPRGELVLHYQPVISLAEGRITGMEALVRWQHPVRGLLFPDTFIPLAERTALINPLTTAVVVTALAQNAEMARQGRNLHLSVNLSARNLHDPEFSARFMEEARASDFPLERLILEVTESAIMADPGRARAVLTELHDAGIKLSMDDFGIGQSSLAYLKDLPISRMKIDKSFVLHFREGRNAAIVRSAIELGHNLGLSVTAEGVEDAETAETLREMGCDVAQGYFFSRPLPLDRLKEWLSTSPWGLGEA